MGNKVDICRCCGGVPATLRAHGLYVCSACIMTVKSTNSHFVVTLKAIGKPNQKVFKFPIHKSYH